MRKHIVVVGGGLSGLTTAFRLQELCGKGEAYEITLLEACPRFGGVIRTRRQSNYLMESGADCFLSEKPWVFDLAKRLGIEEKIISTKAQNRRSFIGDGAKLHRMPKGFYLVAPRNLWALLRAPLLSVRGKIRMALEPFVKPKKGTADESVASFIRRRFGQEALEKIGQPMVGGITTSNPEYLSSKAAIPKLFQSEREFGSVKRGLRKKYKQDRYLKKASGPRYSLFLSFKEGMQLLTDTLVAKSDRVQFRTGFSVKSISQQESSQWVIESEEGEKVEAHAVCLAVPSYQAALMIKKVSPDLGNLLRKIQYESMATVNYFFHRDQIRHTLKGFGFVVPASMKTKTLACTFSSQKFEGRVSDDHVVIRAFVGGAFGDRAYAMPDEAMKKEVFVELKKMLGIRGRPKGVWISRHPSSMPQYAVGHEDLVGKIEAHANEYEGLYMTGNAYHGIGIPDCIASAEQTAEKMAEYIRSREWTTITS